MITLSPRAERHLEALRKHYLKLERADALRNLLAAVEEAAGLIEANPSIGLPAPRTYPQMARPRHAWIKSGRYWISYRTSTSPVITGIFFETANIPKRR